MRLTAWFTQLLTDSESILGRKCGSRPPQRRVRNGRNRTAAVESLENWQLLTTFTVNSLTDGTPNTSNDATEFTLREAISAANNPASPEADTIVFQTGLTGTIELTEGELQITDNLTITGPGAASDLVIDAQGNSRVIHATDAVNNLTLNSLTIKNGTTTDRFDHGGGIRFDRSYGSTLTLTNSTVSGNTSTDDGGGIGFVIGSEFDGSLTVHNSIIAGNSAGALGPDFNAPRGTNNLEVQNSIIGDTTGTTLAAGNNNQLNVDWKTVLQNNGVQPILADNGGPTQTIALLPNSPAIGTADPALLPVSELVKPVVATATDVFIPFHGNNLLKDANLTAANFKTTTSPGGSNDAWVTSAPNGGTGDYFANGTADPELLFFLDELQTLSNVAIWGYSDAAGNDVQSFTLEFSTDGGTTFGDAVSLTKPIYDATSNFVSVLAFNGSVQANAVRMTVTDNYFEDSAGGDRVGFNEIRFLSPTHDQRGAGFPRQVGLPDIGAFEAPFQTPIVDTLQDGIDDDYSPGNFSLREAIAVANATAGADEITFAAGLSGTITLNGSDIDITGSVSIVGPGADQLTISGTDRRDFDVAIPCRVPGRRVDSFGHRHSNCNPHHGRTSDCSPGRIRLTSERTNPTRIDRERAVANGAIPNTINSNSAISVVNTPLTPATTNSGWTQLDKDKDALDNLFSDPLALNL